MEKVAGGYKLHEKIKWQGIWTIVLAIGIAVLYGSRVSSLHTVWELGDEAGYLWNAAYFTGTNWDNVASVYPYYGYGYSVILLPIFIFAENGIQLIQGAYVVNILCVIGMYFILIKLLTELGEKVYSAYIPVIAFIACLAPYMASSTLKVICEAFLSFWYCLLLYLLYLTLKKQKMFFSALLGICSSFIFFIHTRAIVVLGMLVVTGLFSVMWKDRKYLKYFLGFLFWAGIVFIVLYIVKSNIINYKNLLIPADETIAKQANLLSVSFFLDRLKWFKPVDYFACFMAKLLYVVYATGAVLFPGCICMGKEVYHILKKHDNNLEDCAAAIVKIFIMVSFAVMLIACTFNGTGNDIRYAVYGRYFEYMFPALLTFSLYFFISYDNEKLNKKMILVCIAITLIIGLGVRDWCISYLKDQSVYVDTYRIAAISRPVLTSKELGSMLESVALISGALLFSYWAVYRKKCGKWIVILLVGMTVWTNTQVCIDKIQEVQDKQIGDKEIAEYILKYRDNQKVYMIDDDSFRYSFYYSRIQVLLKEIPLHVIQPEDNSTIEEGSYVLAYTTTKLKDSFLKEYKLIRSGSAFLLYQKGRGK